MLRAALTRGASEPGAPPLGAPPVSTQPSPAIPAPPRHRVAEPGPQQDGLRVQPLSGGLAQVLRLWLDRQR